MLALPILYGSAQKTSSLKIPSQGFADIDKVYFPSPEPLAHGNMFQEYLLHLNNLFYSLQLLKNPSLVCCVNEFIGSTKIFCQLTLLWALPTPKTILAI